MVAQNQNEPSFKNSWSPQNLSYINIFLHCLLLKWLIVIIPLSTSRAMKEADIPPLTYAYLLRYLGLWILISTYSGRKREGFWSVTTFDQEANPCHHHISGFMSKRSFNATTHEIMFTNTNPPPYGDKFCQILHMVKAWNDHITSILFCSWEICLDKSMSIWHRIWTYPG